MPLEPLLIRRRSAGRLRRFPITSAAAYSLVEVCVALGLFAFLSAGLISLTMQVRTAAEENVYRNTMLTLGQAYLEQIRSLDYATLELAATSSAATILLTGSAGTILTDVNGAALNNGDWAQETLMLDESASGEPRQPLSFRFRPVLTDLATTSGVNAHGLEIRLHYECTYNFGYERTARGSLRTVRSNVPTF